MRLQTAFKTLAVIAGCIYTMSVKAQIEENNASQIVEIGGGGELINNSISKQTTSMTKTGILEGMIGTEFLIIKGWEGKYNSYLKTTEGYAKALKAAATLYAEGVTTLRHLYEITKGITSNPQGILATVSMNNLYAETAAELVKVYNILKYTIDVGGKMNMLTGAERTELLWKISDSMHDLNQKLRQLALSIAYYNMTDVWNKATAGMIDRNHGEIARQAYKRWVRAQSTYRNIQ